MSDLLNVNADHPMFPARITLATAGATRKAELIIEADGRVSGDIHEALKRCRTVEEWLARHAVTKCKPALAGGLSALEKHFGFTPGTQTFAEQKRQQAANAVRASRQKHLRSGKKSGR